MTKFIKKPVGNGGSAHFVKVSQAKPGDILVVGQYLGKEMVPAYDPTKGEVPLHSFLTEEGETVKLNHAGQLTFKLSQVNEGELVEIVFLGKEQIKQKSTGRTVTANQFCVNRLEAAE